MKCQSFSLFFSVYGDITTQVCSYCTVHEVMKQTGTSVNIHTCNVCVYSEILDHASSIRRLLCLALHDPHPRTAPNFSGNNHLLSLGRPRIHRRRNLPHSLHRHNHHHHSRLGHHHDLQKYGDSLRFRRMIYFIRIWHFKMKWAVYAVDPFGPKKKVLFPETFLLWGLLKFFFWISEIFSLYFWDIFSNFNAFPI